MLKNAKKKNGLEKFQVLQKIKLNLTIGVRIRKNRLCKYKKIKEWSYKTEKYKQGQPITDGKMYRNKNIKRDW